MSDEKYDWNEAKKDAAHKVLQSLFDHEAVYDETFRRIKGSPTLRARLDDYNAACVAYDWEDMSVEEFNELENAYYAEVFAPVSQKVAAEVLKRAIDLSRYQPYGPREDVTAQTGRSPD